MSRAYIESSRKAERGAPARRPDNARSLLLAILLAFLAAGCATRVELVNATVAEAAPKFVYVVSHGWHTGIVIARADLPENWPGLEDFARADYLEFGWGDAEFYPAKEGTLWLAIKALFWPTPSVLHVAGITGNVTAFFPASRMVRINLLESGFVRLLRFIRDTYWLGNEGRAIPVAAGLYGDGNFYQARGKFYFPKTCNYWTVVALREAGFPVIPLLAVTAGGVLSQVERHGELVQK
ncbi:MAG: DUF2459 domain-containing protein [Candidatus Binatia bacterium]